MYCKTLNVKNFLSISEASLNLENRKLVLIEGVIEGSSSIVSNGAGKSSLFEAIYWVLFDTTSRGVSKDHVVNNVIGKDCEVELVFDEGGSEYKVTRTRKHGTKGNTLEIYCDGKNISGSTSSNSQKVLNSILPFDMLLFDSIVYLSQGMHSKFMSRSDLEKKSIIEQILNSLVYEKCIAITKEKLSAFKKFIDSKTQELSNAKRTLELRKNNYNAKLTEITTIEKDTLEKIKDVESRTVELNGHLLQQEEKVKSLSNSYQEQSTKLSVAKEECKKALIALKELESLVKKHENKKCSVHCPECGVHVYGQNTGSEKENYWKVQKEYNLLRDKEVEEDKLFNTISSEIKHTNSQIDAIKRKIVYQDEIIAGHKKYIAQSSSILKEAEEELRLSDNLYNSIDQEIRSCEENTKYFEYLNKAFFDIRSLVLTDALDCVNQSLQGYVDELFGSGLKIKVQPIKESLTGEITSKFSILLIDNENRTRDYASFSEGERRRIDLALHISLI